MWTRFPNANVGTVCGVNFDVFDADSCTVLEELWAFNGRSSLAISGQPSVVTGRGWHIYFKVLGSSIPKIPGYNASWLSRGHYVVAPPSIHANGHPYYWVDCDRGANTPPAPIPLWLPPVLFGESTSPAAPQTPVIGLEDVEVLDRPSPTIGNPRAYALAALTNAASEMASTAEGNRNNTLNKLTFALTRRFVVERNWLGLGEVTNAMEAAALKSGLTQREIESTIKSAVTAAAAATTR